ncbi:ATP-dependent metallopeptidase FtsH/Yme1/Tma family protein [Tenacibaculum sp. AHE15PA]|uniref:ATP-dependent zinc metalloprotease FtsH n=1 Tax=unclassified Tenacibaculum TaxID=2635139 RepID=UPI001C4E2EB4|nr:MULTISPECIES: ATP-dependent zinc metalloprotease FtsH [unclassified Tenacibaculum]QXP74252.1 ATP-dependent metallopeptidase FtsH/Yme1/Tma family protein [Tenacibaculum sp. AHE14PA]QXP75378.1 ATP-dependent metallopeptidase FtsH/Yme1/Tma family protein [Tenacibaculum sp. AHE15PA]
MSDKKKNPPKFSFNSFWIYIPILVVLLGLSFFNSNDLGSRSISKNEFHEILQENDIQKIVIENNNVAQIFLKSEAEKKEQHKKITDSPFYRKGSPLYTYNFGDLQNFENEIKKEKAENNLDFDRTNVEPTSLVKTLFDFLPFILLIGIWLFFMKRMSGGGSGAGGGGQIFNIGKSKAKLFDENTKVKTTFKNVAGLEGAKEEIQEIVDFLKTPEKYTKLGGKIPKGALLVGPPGTGKTLLAKAVAGEAGVPFFSLSGSDFVEMFVGVGASRVRDLFKQAQQKSPSIIFIDEIDAIGRARGKNSMTGGNDERENTLNQLLTEMDGFGTDTNVIVLAATNRADVLDKALMRAGRFDRQIYVDLPDLHERREIFEVHIKPLKLAENADLELLAQQTPGFSGADIANLCNEAALIAARNNKEAIEHQDFLDAVDRIVGGLEKKNKVITPKEKKVIAFHEAGHATVSWMLEHAAPLVKVTIVPRGQSLGAAWYLPEERKIIQTEQMLDEMCATMGGRAAEKLMFNKISTGALSDLEKVTKQARAMVTVYGLNEKVGNITYYDSSGNDSFVKPYSDDTAKTIDEEISKMIEFQYQRAIDLLSEHKDKLNLLADLLLEKEVMFKADLEKIFGERPFEKKENKTNPVIEE